MSDLNEILKRVYEEDKVEEVLVALECENINRVSGRFEAQLPERFHSGNKRAVQVYDTEKLQSRVRNKGVSGNLFMLIGFILYDIDEFEVLKDNLFQVKAWLCNLFDWDEYLELGYDFSEERKDYLPFLSEIRDKRKKRKNISKSTLNKKNEPIDIDVLYPHFDKMPHKRFIEDGILAKTQVEYGVMFDRMTERIVFPIHDKDGNIVSVKGRYVGSDLITLDEKKYMFLHFPFDKQLELFNYHKAYEHTQKMGEVIVFESEKSCMLAWQYGFKHTVSTMGYEISPYQSFLLRKLGVNIIYAYDKGIDYDFIRKQAKIIKTRKCFYIDSNEFDELDDKDAPVDKGVKLWKKIYEQGMKSIT